MRRQPRDRATTGPTRRIALTLTAMLASVLLVVTGIAWILHDAGQPAAVTRRASPSEIRQALSPPASRTAPRVSKPRSAPTAPARPRVLSLPSLGSVLPIVPVGVSSDGQMQMPPDPADIGWYRYGPRPGSSIGSAVLAGHVDSFTYGVGPLARLSSLHVGNRVRIRTRTQILSFRVTQVRVIAKSQVALAELFRRGGPASLRIVTCGPPYIADQGGYQDNVIVTAIPI